MLTKGNIVKFKNSMFFPDDMMFVVVDTYPEGYILANTKNGAKSGYWQEEELEFVDNGDTIFADSLSLIWDKNKEDQRSIEWIKDNWDGKLRLNWNSILFLYDKIGYNVKIRDTDEFEFYWYVLYPIFKEIFFGTKRRALKETKRAFGSNRDKFIDKIAKLYDEVNNE